MWLSFYNPVIWHDFLNHWKLQKIKSWDKIQSLMEELVLQRVDCKNDFQNLFSVMNCGWDSKSLLHFQKVWHIAGFHHNYDFFIFSWKCLHIFQLGHVIDLLYSWLFIAICQFILFMEIKDTYYWNNKISHFSIENPSHTTNPAHSEYFSISF